MECEAWILYVTQHGDILGSDEATITAYNDLIDAVENTEWSKLMKSYAIETKATYANAGINGRSVLDTLSFGINLADSEQRIPQKILRLLGQLSLIKAFHGPRRPMTVGLFAS